MISKREFINSIMRFVEDRPSDWRKGQAVFNYVDQEYGIARNVQFKRNIDCFYDDSRIDEFIEAAWQEYSATNVNDFPGDNMIEE